MKSSLIIFTKVPIPGLVKTRLTQNTCLTELDSAKIAEAMLKDTISLASKTNFNIIQIGYFPEEGSDYLNEIIEEVRKDGRVDKPIELILQNGSNFDQRFGSIVENSFRENINYLVILGSDSPFLDPQVINKALEILDEKVDEKPIIIGPSSGGGIYLLGITHHFNPNWFSEYNLFSRGLELSRFSIFSKDNQLPLISFPPYGDIDVEEDLVSLITYIELLNYSEKNIGFHFPYYTANIIKDLRLYIIDDQNQTRRRKIAKKR
jgi:glycosyltransferase A (GT-A) superfamily protein (DUF2064 family)